MQAPATSPCSSSGRLAQHFQYAPVTCLSSLSLFKKLEGAGCGASMHGQRLHGSSAWAPATHRPCQRAHATCMCAVTAACSPSPLQPSRTPPLRQSPPPRPRPPPRRQPASPQATAPSMAGAGPEASQTSGAGGAVCSPLPDDGLGALVEAESLLVPARTPYGRGLATQQAVAARQVLVSIPLSNALVVSDEGLEGMSISTDRCHQMFQERHGEMPEALLAFITGTERWDVRMTAYLLWVMQHCTQDGAPGGSASTALWRRYRDSLPSEREASCLLSFINDQEMAELQLKELQEEAKAQREWIAWVHDKHLSASRGDLRALKLALTPLDTFWAAAMVRTRTFSDDVAGEGMTLMVPFADLANHSFTQNSTFGVGKGKNSFELRSTADIGASREATITYGENKSNAELLRDYGFIIPGNPNDRLHLPDKDSLPRINGESFRDALGLKGNWKDAKGDLLALGASSTAGSAADAELRIARLRNAVYSLPLTTGYDKQAAGKGGGGLFAWAMPSQSWTSTGEPPARQLVAGEVAAERQAVQQLHGVLLAQLTQLPTSIEQDRALLQEYEAKAAAAEPGGRAGQDPLGITLPKASGAKGKVWAPPASPVRLAAAVSARLEHKLLLRTALDALDAYASWLG